MVNFKNKYIIYGLIIFVLGNIGYFLFNSIRENGELTERNKNLTEAVEELDNQLYETTLLLDNKDSIITSIENKIDILKNNNLSLRTDLMRQEKITNTYKKELKYVKKKINTLSHADIIDELKRIFARHNKEIK